MGPALHQDCTLCCGCGCVRVLISNLPCRVICLGIPAKNQSMNIIIYRKWTHNEDVRHPHVEIINVRRFTRISFHCNGLSSYIRKSNVTRNTRVVGPNISHSNLAERTLMASKVQSKSTSKTFVQSPRAFSSSSLSLLISAWRAVTLPVASSFTTACW